MIDLNVPRHLQSTLLQWRNYKSKNFLIETRKWFRAPSLYRDFGQLNRRYKHTYNYNSYTGTVIHTVFLISHMLRMSVLRSIDLRIYFFFSNLHALFIKKPLFHLCILNIYLYLNLKSIKSIQLVCYTLINILRISHMWISFFFYWSLSLMDYSKYRLVNSSGHTPRPFRDPGECDLCFICCRLWVSRFIILEVVRVTRVFFQNDFTRCSELKHDEVFACIYVLSQPVPA